MDLPQLSSIIMNLSTLVFVVTSMLVMGLVLGLVDLSALLITASLLGRRINDQQLS